MSDLLLRALDPVTERHFFEEAYSWRKAKTSPLRADRASLDDISTPRPDQLMMGLFNGRLEAVYWITQTYPHVFDTHFTSRRDCPREWVLAAAKTILASLLDSGAIEVTAYVKHANRPLCHFVEQIGFCKDCLVKLAQRVKLKQTDCQDGEKGGSVSVVFVKYAARKVTIGPFRQKTNQHGYE